MGKRAAKDGTTGAGGSARGTAARDTAARVAVSSESDRAHAEACARIALDRKAQDVRILHVGKALGIADYFVLATVHNRRQARAVRDAIRLALKAEGAGVPLASSEDPDGRWSLYDYGGVVVHLFDSEGRRYFDLDGRWRDAPALPVPEDVPAARAATARDEAKARRALDRAHGHEGGDGDGEHASDGRDTLDDERLDERQAS